MKEYYTTIGLEIHAELKTKTKMFCNSKNDPDEKQPNVNVCPICMGHPGTLPVINKEAVKHVLKMGVALNGQLADFTEFDRKNYFYPDIPKSYQLSQYKYPLVSGGELHGIKITRVHLEEDTGTSQHEGDHSLVNYNRAGVPLMELVTEPVIHTAEDAVNFAKELQLLLRYIGAGEANMEKGEMRVEANISVSDDPKKFGTKVEVKNLNSFRAVERAIAYEVERHTEALEKGEKIVQETRGWNETKEQTYSQRTKEDSHDYRYFPDPDLPKLYISEIPEFEKDVLEKELGELPWAKRERYKKEFELRDEDVEIYIQSPEWGHYFEAVLRNLGIEFLNQFGNSIPKDRQMAKLASNYISSDLLGLVKKEPEFWQKKPIDDKHFAELIKMLGENKVSSRGAKDILALMYKEGGEPAKIAQEKGLLQKSDEGELKTIIEKIIADNPKVVADYKAGKEASLQFLIGQGMKATKGSANPEVLKNLFKSTLG
ncbi:Asp-tRNA(Asn)/Glu-tRNA(Gln) amidotransferase subunit GatB [Candidatus Parcubacteria bacterium]|nr:Asp-tRNA(Asn)/Glu-tRNA(Gln) amidotransferase subunit GatB [Candidatus Parcubacteria bacterium]